MSYSRLVVVGLVVAMLAGCAGYSITEGGTGSGYDVYGPAPYLLVTYGEKEWTGQIVWLPNLKKRYRVYSWSVFAKADITFKFENGWLLTELSNKGDSTAFGTKLLDIVASRLPPVTAKGGGAPAKAGDPISYLYRLVLDDKNGYFTSLVEVGRVNLP